MCGITGRDTIRKEYMKEENLKVKLTWSGKLDCDDYCHV